MSRIPIFRRFSEQNFLSMSSFFPFNEFILWDNRAALTFCLFDRSCIYVLQDLSRSIYRSLYMPLGAYAFSCKGFSSARSQGPNRSLLIQLALGTSGKTARDLLAYLQAHSPAAIIIENAEDFVHESHGQLAYFRELLDQIGYDTIVLVLRSNHYYLPQGRVKNNFCVHKL